MDYSTNDFDTTGDPLRKKWNWGLKSYFKYILCMYFTYTINHM